MTIFSSFLVCVVCSALSIISKGNAHEIDKNLFTYFFRGSFQRFYEALFPKSIAFRLQVKKRRNQLTAEICDIVGSMNDGDIAWMHAYFRGVEEKLKKKHSLNWDFATEDTWRNQKRVSEYARTMYDIWAKRLDQAQGASILPGGVSAEQFALDMGGEINGRCMPESVKRIVSLINNYLYELRYLHMSSVNKDLVQVMKYMIEEGNAKLLDGIKEQLDIVAQWNDREGGNAQVSDVASVAARDPYCFVRLVCPSCRASGGAVRRYETYAECAVCGERYEIIRNVDKEDEIQKLIERKSQEFQQALYERMGVVISEQETRTERILEAQDNGVQTLSAQIDELWNRVKQMTYESSQSLFHEVRHRGEADRVALEQRMEDAETRMERMLAECLDQHTANILSMCQSGMDKLQQDRSEKSVEQMREALNDTLRQVREGMDQAASQNNRQLDEIKNRIDHYQRLMKGEMDRLHEQVTAEGDRQERGFAEMRTMFESWTDKLEVLLLDREPIPETHENYCALCRQHTRSADGILCPRCKREYGGGEPIVPMILTRAVENPNAFNPTYIVKLAFKEDSLPELPDDRPVRVQLFVDTDTVREIENAIHRHNRVLRMERRVQRTVKGDWLERRISPDQIVLVGDNEDVRVSSVFANALRDELFPTVHKVVAGLGITMEMPAGNERWIFTGEHYEWRNHE